MAPTVTSQKTMRKESPPQSIQPPALWLRIALLLTIALALAATIAAGTTDAPYEDRLVDVALRQTSAADWSSVAAQPIALKALLLDYDHELAFKAQLGLEKYGADAQDVLLRFGDDPTFQEVIRQYGENILPVIAYFVKNDVASIRLSYLAQQKSEAAIAAAQGFWAKLWQPEPVESPSAADKEKDKDTAQELATYGPDLRGQRAIAFIAHEGHAFLAQFVLDPQGQAVWVQTERTLGAAKTFFFSGVIGLEKKYKSGQPLEAVDVLSAGMDVFIVVGTFKALKFLRAGQQARAVGVMKRTQLLGAPLLRGSTLGRYAMKYGAIAGTAYVVVKHPSLLNGVFVTIGQWLGLSPFLAKLGGWSLLLVPLLLPLLSLFILVVSMAGTLFRMTGKSLRWTLRRLGFSRAAA